jgi:hypothetical protein
LASRYPVTEISIRLACVFQLFTPA